MLDSSPVALPPRRPLKRSASNASMPTPPRTHSRYTRGRSRGSCDSDSEEDALPSIDDQPKYKRRRTGENTRDGAEEEAFWLEQGGSAGLNTEQDKLPTTTVPLRPESRAEPVIYRKLKQQQSQTDVAPVSPPPSHRKPVVTTPKAVRKDDAVGPSTVSPPVTPKARSNRRALAFRDSPDNPFLATPLEDSATPSPGSSENPSPHTPHQERPTVTYVFRGVRRVYQNPLYNHAENRPLSPPAASKLPLEDPDYSPAMHCTPKMLFPEARRKASKKQPTTPTRGRTAGMSTRKTRRSLSVSEYEDDGAAEIKPMKLNFGVADKKQGGPVKTLAQELRTAGEGLPS